MPFFLCFFTAQDPAGRGVSLLYFLSFLCSFSIFLDASVPTDRARVHGLLNRPQNLLLGSAPENFPRFLTPF